MPATSPLQRTWTFLRRRNTVGFRRVASSMPKILQMTFCAVAAYWFAEKVLGHEGPIFAATSAMIALGFGGNTRVRRTLEVAIGCTLGIALGDALLSLLGTGIWQAALVLFLSLVIARYLDNGPIFSTQLGLQSLLVVLLPVSESGPFARSLDAVVGGVLAILITMVVPRDPRREPIAELGRLLHELSQVLHECSMALRESDSTRAWHALIRARATQPLMDKIPGLLAGAAEVAMLAPVHRRHRPELESLRLLAEKSDLAVRNSRVFARRMATVITHASLTDRGVEAVSAVLVELAEAADALARAVAEPTDTGREKAMARVRIELGHCAGTLDPEALDISGLQGEGLVLLLRPLVVDLLEAAGSSHEDASAMLARL
ncbi:FUSC family protein [Paeniglutamicibacter cryotolerans]|uniref:Uncharacterized membrane protein YgaE (UPF0421/DUF939 family) n=1 Tax=Paeniglutamicibacter cryotolerans TaxID=670079 RepID=A0A839QP93_9MICC|nr:FUSC family protein [Paeniglutamicibacter cryotolerans]MBB2995042.1 uncharacterized membrane protein YgaE (UPF0421/DUF939 family) [Paeniglutamicibacter cryotolerans]